MKETIRMMAPAKLNLYLKVIGRRPDGFHEVEMVMQAISLVDSIEIKVGDFAQGHPVYPAQSPSLEVKGWDPRVEMPSPKDNLVIQAIELLQRKYRLPPVHVTLTKQIPVEAGLAGGSSDAAAVLKGLNLLFDLQISQNQLMELGLELGSDVPFCLYGGTALAAGRGEQLSSLPPFPKSYFVLFKPPFGVSTARVYKALSAPPLVNRDGEKHPLGATQILSGLENSNLKEIALGLENDMEGVVLNWHSQLKEWLTTMGDCGALAAMMSGSGPTIFGLFDSYDDAMRAYRVFGAMEGQVFLAEPINTGAIPVGDD